MRRDRFMKKMRKLIATLLLVWLLVCCVEGLAFGKQSNVSISMNTDFKPTGHAELDAVRR